LTATFACLFSAGCTRESVRVALDTQRRADNVQHTIFEHQHQALRILLYRDLVQQLEAGGTPISAGARDVLNEAWNDRDLVEFWARQYERSVALRIAGVDAKLAADQSTIDLLIKAVEAKVDRAKTGLAAAIGETLAPPVESLAEPEAQP
jgi:hypothetical protein